MPRTMLSDKLWQKLKPILLDLNIYDKPNLRNTLEGILFRMRNGCTWRDIPEAFGCHNESLPICRRLNYLEWVHWFNCQRIFEPLGYISPARYEKAYYDRLKESTLVA